MKWRVYRPAAVRNGPGAADYSGPSINVLAVNPCRRGINSFRHCVVAWAEMKDSSVQ